MDLYVTEDEPGPDTNRTDVFCNQASDDAESFQELYFRFYSSSSRLSSLLFFFCFSFVAFHTHTHTNTHTHTHTLSLYITFSNTHTNTHTHTAPGQQWVE